MLELDGSAGGGQLVRTALGLSVVSGRAFEMTDVRGSRSTPGLRHQHHAAVEAAAAVADAEVADGDGDDPGVGTETLAFEPEAPTGGDYRVDIGTAGSVTLLFDALLPLATALERPLSVTVRGGTDVQWSPPMAYLRHVKLPVLRAHGLWAAVDLERRGFYPEGGGEATLHLAPSDLDPVVATDSDATEARVYSVASDDLAEPSVAERQAEAAAEKLAAAGVEVVGRRASYGTAPSTGSAVVVAFAGAPAGFAALGEQGKQSETVAAEAAEAALSFREGPAAVDAHMADQLVPVLALGGGEVRIPEVTDHVATAVDLVAEFGYEVTIEEREAGALLRG